MILQNCKSCVHISVDIVDMGTLAASPPNIVSLNMAFEPMWDRWVDWIGLVDQHPKHKQYFKRSSILKRYPDMRSVFKTLLSHLSQQTSYIVLTTTLNNVKQRVSIIGLDRPWAEEGEPTFRGLVSSGWTNPFEHIIGNCYWKLKLFADFLQA